MGLYTVATVRMRVFTIAAAAILLFTVGHAQAGEPDSVMLYMDEKEFEELFDLDPVVDPQEFEKRQNALKSNEELIKQVNQEYAEGKKTWYDSVNEFSDLPEDEFVSKMTGLIIPEDKMVDCGYGINGANACNGAAPHAYLKWAGDELVKFASEEQYPYAESSPSLTCPDNLPVFNQGAEISGSYFTYGGDEDLLKKLVYTHGSVLAGVYANYELQNYRGGIFSGCPSNSQPNHAISVVGYGTENGVDYWLIKNSWGTWWGDNGYFKLKRGVQMCGIGPVIVATECQKSSDPIYEETTTSAPETTVDPSCVDNIEDCPALAEFWCWDRFIKRRCKFSCGQCKGQSPAPSALSFDKYSDCEMLVDYCDYKFVEKRCKKTCSAQAK